MSALTYNILAVVLSLTILYGIHLMNSPKTAVKGNAIGAVAMALAIVVTLFKDGTLTLPVLWISMAIGTFLGLYCSTKVKMIQMPQYVALLNGFGGAASALVALMVLVDSGATTVFSKSTAGLALLVGTLTLTGSLVAAGKLHQVLAQKPVVLNNHSRLCNIFIAVQALVLLLLVCSADTTPVLYSLLLLLLSGAFGILFTIRVGGADMPITISLLNSLSGVAGAIAGLAIADPLLVAVGGIVGASGLLLTQIMCRAMNRSLMDILLGKTSMTPEMAAKAAAKRAFEAESKKQAEAEALSVSIATAAAVAAASAAPSPASPAALLHAAKKVIIIPGYGMALAQAQHKVKALAEALEAHGASVDYAIHPVAGRMPGHMNVLLAEAGVDYEKLLEMDGANPLFPDTDLVIIVGANDVINPAAREAEGTPIYGMPILDAGKAKNIIICNFDLKPGYAGVDNPLYTRDEVCMLLGDANESVDKLLGFLLQPVADSAEAILAAQAVAPQVESASSLSTLVQAAKKVIIIPGYGMALAQAQHKVKALAEKFEEMGANVEYAIHPVAGRMPGHMNVLLAEAGVDYEKLLEMDAANPLFPDTDLVVIVGANDVVNPAAREAEGTPIYGMPILDAVKAKHIVICNYDLKPGYAGVENPLYTSKSVTMLLGDANNTVDEVIAALNATVAASAAPCACGCTAHAPAAADAPADLESLFSTAKKVMIIPGYGMALAQAQHKVKALADKLEAKGVQVDYAIHPVAGRMPGHMNVLLAEADVDYEKLLEMDAANPLFADADIAIVVGANDVVNPAAIVAEGTPIYGMPILRVDEAKNIIICNFDLKPGYAGVENPLYARNDVTMLLGDANDSVAKLLQAIR